MKILSYNIRGAGSSVKLKEVRDSIRKFNIDVYCVQETKLENGTKLNAKSLWGEGNFGWVARESIGRSGGIMTLWNANSCKSKLDRMLTNSEWIARWPSAFLKGLQRSVSNHCPIILKSKHIN